MREHLSDRKKWQHHANTGGSGRENQVFMVAETLLRKSKHKVDKKIIALYPNGRGIKPDCMITNTETGKIALIEVKRQGGTGNAHERLCRNYMLGIQDELEKICGFRYPVFTVCLNGLAKDKHKSQEIQMWFESPEIQDRLFLWKTNKADDMIAYLQDVILPHLL